MTSFGADYTTPPAVAHLWAVKVLPAERVRVPVRLTVDTSDSSRTLYVGCVPIELTGPNQLLNQAAVRRRALDRGRWLFPLKRAEWRRLVDRLEREAEYVALPTEGVRP